MRWINIAFEVLLISLCENQPSLEAGWAWCQAPGHHSDELQCLAVFSDLVHWEKEPRTQRKPSECQECQKLKEHEGAEGRSHSKKKKRKDP